MSEPTEKDIKDANRLLKRVQDDPTTVKIRPSDLDRLESFGFSDAAWGSPDLPQSGHLHVVGVPAVRDDEKLVIDSCCVVAGTSRRLRRVCRSSFAAETIACVDSIDSCLMDRKLYELVLDRKLIHRQLNDCKSLQTCFLSNNPTCSERRLLIDIMSIKESAQRAEIHEMIHISNSVNAVDELTKMPPIRVPSLLRRFLDSNKLEVCFLSRAEIALRKQQEKEYVSEAEVPPLADNDPYYLRLVDAYLDSSDFIASY
jgi:hypothetical protein